MRRTPAALIALVGLSAAALTGCSDKAEPTPTTAPPAATQSQAPSAEQTPTAEQTSSAPEETTGGAEKPAAGETESITVSGKTFDAPKGFTFPEGSEVTAAAAVTDAGTVTLSKPGLDEVVAHFAKLLPELGYTVTAQSAGGLAAEGNGFTVGITTTGTGAIVAWTSAS